MGFETPSPIQAQAIPTLLTDERDLIGLAQTGTGKTAAFGLPLLERVDPEFPHTQALILAPTRELGQQIGDQLQQFSKYQKSLRVQTVYGGAPIHQQIKNLRHRPQVLIATPGRLIDLLERKALELDYLEILVLDEADEMLNMGFKDELDTILSHAPAERMTWLFSATMPKEIRRMVTDYMTNPFEVRVDQELKVNTRIEHQFVGLRYQQKTEALKRFIDFYPDLRAVVFCRTKIDTQNVAEELMKEGYQADALHGDMSQAQRDRVMRRFKEHQLPILIATDVAARGIDVNDLTHVFHYALPDDPSYYTHRSGRTARAGKEGISLAFVGPRDLSRIKFFENNLNIKFRKVDIPRVEDIARHRMEKWTLEILQQPFKGKIPPGVFEEIDLMWSGLSREELIAKVISYEMERLKLSEGEDLNVDHRRQGKGGDRGGKKGKPRFQAKRKEFHHGHKRQNAKRKPKGKKGSK